jgi:hypothetical protein
MMFIILNWSDKNYVLPVMSEDGTVLLFNTEEEATEYAEEELNFN